MLETHLQSRARMLTTGEAYKRFVLYLYRFSTSTQSTYQRAIKQFLRFAPKQISRISVEHIERFTMRQKNKCSAATANLHLAAIKSWFNWMETCYEIPNIAKRVRRLKTLPPHQRVLTREEYDKIVESTKGYMRDIIQVLCMTGLRASEFLSLTPANINCQFLTVIGKGQKQRTVPLNETAQRILKTTSLLNLIKNKKRLWLFRLCRRAAKAANIPVFSPHSCRHYFATELHNAKPKPVPIETIGKLLGHSSPLVTTMTYLHSWSDSSLDGLTRCLE